MLPAQQRMVEICSESIDFDPPGRPKTGALLA
jgi:hypothetical protein